MLRTVCYTERELLLLLKQGDKVAFEEIYRLYSPQLLGKMIRLVKSEDIAAELLQETFLKLWNSRSQIDPGQTFRSYLFTIAQNVAFDFFRKLAKDKKLQTALLRSAIVRNLNEESKYMQKEEWNCLQSAISTLPPQRRYVFELVKLEGRSYQEVSQLLNISTSTISDHIVKAIKFLRHHLK